MIKRLLLALILLFSLEMVGQDTLNLLNGKYKVVQADSMDFDFFYYHKIKKDGKLGSKKKKNLDHIFSVGYKNGETRYVYQEDTLLDNIFTIAEMKYYLEGRRQARIHYKPYKTMLMGAGLGTGVALYSLFPIKYGERSKVTEVYDPITNTNIQVLEKVPNALTVPIPYWELIPLGVFVYYQGAAKNTKSFKADDKEMFKSQAFVVGYQETVINKKVFAAIGSAISSWAITMAGYIYLDPVKR